ncbi:hypothetical protein [Nonomuraea rubra]|uniref:hypothetical protein n=1 Tax=Nonomuraea rubra TaxID=46180 RepID=UPI0033E95F26
MTSAVKTSLLSACDAGQGGGHVSGQARAGDVDLAYSGAGRPAVELLPAERVRAGVHRLPAELRARQSVGPPPR